MAAQQIGWTGRPPQGLAPLVPLGAALSWRGTVVGLLLHLVAPMAFVPPVGLVQRLCWECRALQTSWWAARSPPRGEESGCALGCFWLCVHVSQQWVPRGLQLCAMTHRKRLAEMLADPIPSGSQPMEGHGLSQAPCNTTCWFPLPAL